MLIGLPRNQDNATSHPDLQTFSNLPPPSQPVSNMASSLPDSPMGAHTDESATDIESGSDMEEDSDVHDEEELAGKLFVKTL